MPLKPVISEAPSWYLGYVLEPTSVAALTPKLVWLKLSCVYFYTFMIYWNIYNKILVFSGLEECHVPFRSFCIHTSGKYILNSVQELFLSHFRAVCSAWKFCHIWHTWATKHFSDLKRKIWCGFILLFLLLFYFGVFFMVFILFCFKPNVNITSLPSYSAFFFYFTESFYTPSIVSICC